MTTVVSYIPTVCQIVNHLHVFFVIVFHFLLDSGLQGEKTFTERIFSIYDFLFQSHNSPMFHNTCPEIPYHDPSLTLVLESAQGPCGQVPR